MCHPAPWRGNPFRRATPLPVGRGFRAKARNDTWGFPFLTIGRIAARGLRMTAVGPSLLNSRTAEQLNSCHPLIDSRAQ